MSAKAWLRIVTLDDLLAHSAPEPNTGCRLWLGAVNPKGYGRVRFRGSAAVAHRVAFILAYGEIPEGQFALHRCDTPSCINPDHLFLGSALDNTRDCIAKGRFVNNLRQYQQ